VPRFSLVSAFCLRFAHTRAAASITVVPGSCLIRRFSRVEKGFRMWSRVSSQSGLGLCVAGTTPTPAHKGQQVL
ncbi:MAG TPA: hypothetical protein VK357_11940, partial [Rubrobacteraceae bacterium]|nr:hypothetical protein [Rubrobacteraceae bacterium]